MAFLVNFGCILATGMNFCPIFLFFYKCGLLLRNVATSFRKAVITHEVMAFLVDFGWNLATGMNFCPIFLYFVNVVYYSYEIGLRGFERLRLPVVKLWHFW